MLYHFSTSAVRRARNESTAGRAAYIFGKRLYDVSRDAYVDNQREDVIWGKVFLPPDAPEEYRELQAICDAMEKAEKRKDARTARQYIASLPREVPQTAQIRIVGNFIEENFTNNGICALAAIHHGRDELDAKRNNPHVHILVSTRKADATGFCRKKERVLDAQSHLVRLRRQWADAQNREYARYQLPYRISPEMLREDPAHGIEVEREHG